MSPSNLAGEVIGTALRQMAVFAVWVILVVAVVAAIVIGLSALRRRQDSGLRHQAADCEAVARRSIRSHTLLLEGAWPEPARYAELPPRERLGDTRLGCR
jgi:hypothetical protein